MRGEEGVLRACCRGRRFSCWLPVSLKMVFFSVV